MQKYYQNKPRFNGVYSSDNLPKTIKNGAYEIILDADAWTHWIALYVLSKDVFFLAVLELNTLLKKLKILLGKKRKNNYIQNTSKWFYNV